MNEGGAEMQIALYKRHVTFIVALLIIKYYSNIKYAKKIHIRINIIKFYV